MIVEYSKSYFLHRRSKHTRNFTNLMLPTSQRNCETRKYYATHTQILLLLYLITYFVCLKKWGTILSESGNLILVFIYFGSEASNIWSIIPCNNDQTIWSRMCTFTPEWGASTPVRWTVAKCSLIRGPQIDISNTSTSYPWRLVHMEFNSDTWSGLCYVTFVFFDYCRNYLCLIHRLTSKTDHWLIDLDRNSVSVMSSSTS